MFQDIRNVGYFTAKIGKFHTFSPDWGEDFEDYADHYRAIGFEYAEETPGPFMTPFHRSNYTRHLKARGLLTAYQENIAWRLAEGQYTVRPSPVPPEDHNDAFIGQVVEAMERRGTWEEMLTFFLSDHGDHMGAHGRMGKGSFFRGVSESPADCALAKSGAF